MKYRKEMHIYEPLVEASSDSPSGSDFQSTGFDIQPRNGKIPQIPQPTSTAERWAAYVLRGCKSNKDLKTINVWAHHVAVSYTTLCETCRLIGVQPRQARDFTRILRAVTRSSFDFLQIASFLDVSDRRTLESILKNTGLVNYTNGLRPASVLSFIDNQHFISCDNAGLRIIRGRFALLEEPEYVKTST